MLDITAETKKVREDMEKQGYVLTEEEYQIVLEYTIRKSDRCGKGRDYVPLLLEDEIKNYYFRNTVTAISLINMAVPHRHGSGTSWIFLSMTVISFMLPSMQTTPGGDPMP